jgi:hypothetical protein
VVAFFGTPCDKTGEMRLRWVMFTVAVIFAGCRAPRMATPADLVSLADEIVVTNRSRATGLFANETFGMGPYPVTRVHRSATSTKSSGFKLGDIGSESSSSLSFYDFDMTTPLGVYKGSCSVNADSKETHFGNWVVGGSGSQVLDCNCSGGGPGVTKAYVQLVPQVRGVLVHRSGAAAPLEPSSATEGGGHAVFGMTLGYEAAGTPPLGAVDVMHPGRVWINRTLGAGEQADLACLFGGLLLYQPPATPH